MCGATQRGRGGSLGSVATPGGLASALGAAGGVPGVREGSPDGGGGGGTVGLATIFR